jgi:hypothetical protein
MWARFSHNGLTKGRLGKPIGAGVFPGPTIPVRMWAISHKLNLSLLKLKSPMRPLVHLCFLTLVAAASVRAAVVTYGGVSVSCKETTHALATETLSISFNSTANGGTISGGAIGADSCAFQLTNQVVFQPFVDGTYSYAAAVAGNEDTVFWAAAFCNTSTTNDQLVIADASPTGNTFTITSGSITTMFTITSLATAVPEPAQLALAGAGLFGLAAFLRKRRKAASL